MQGYQSNDIIRTVHRKVEIVYDDRRNRWDFTLRGKKRHADSLFKAKSAVDTDTGKG